VIKKIIIAGLLLILPLYGGMIACRPTSFSVKMITVKRIGFPCKKPPIALVEKMLDSCNIKFNKIDCVNWTDYPYKPDVKFRIAWSVDEIYLQYVVREKYVRAHFIDDTGAQPYKDSAVEFFMIPGNDSIYYNLELNCIGVGTFAGGALRTDRTRFGKNVTEQIRRSSSLGKSGFDTQTGDFEWKITIAIPLSIYSLSDVPPLAGRIVKANFYKCGDELPEKCYLSWNPIVLEKPNFHSPQFFGELLFEN